MPSQGDIVGYTALRRERDSLQLRASMRSLLAAFLTLANLGSAPVARAQVDTADTERIGLAPGARVQPDTTRERPRLLCWRGAPLARCRAILLTELAFEQALLTTTYRDLSYNPDDERADFSFRLRGGGGLMVNVSPRHAVGVARTAYVGFHAGGDDVSRGAWEVRLRRWMDPRHSLDLTVARQQHAVQRTDSSHAGGRTELLVARGPTIALMLSRRDVWGVYARADLLHDGERPRRALYGGVKAGAWAGPIGWLLTAAGVVLLVSGMG